MKGKTNWELFVEDFKSLSVQNKHMAWKYVKKLKIRQENGTPSYKYLSIFRPEVKSFVIKIDKEEGLNLYHSITSFINNRQGKTSDKIFEEYMSTYKEERDYLKGNEDIIRELIDGIYNKFKNEGRI
ncbi:MAG: hypothetical protein GX981_02725 [Tissierellia bacterium]|nr:hypothetical protein [Tissierellia bacterium]